ncbi:MAG TPA: hypothetical protein VFB02_08570 [Bradyrhizobium sp.]|nr:hypothetical protein [Bradyrhizobium sp.]
MRIAKVIVAGSVAGALALATPALAKHSDAQKPAEEAAVSSPCHAYEMGPDGTWHQQPCQEAGAPAPRKSSGHGGVSEAQTR